MSRFSSCRFAAAVLSVAALGRGAMPSPRPAAPWPPPAGVLQVILDTDAGAEVDDQYALALALAHPERLKIEGVVGAHFGDYGGPTGVQKSVDEIHRVLAHAGLTGKIPVRRGADPFTYRDAPPDSDGVQFIIARAKQATPVDPLWLVLLGPATDAAAALQRAPEIADRLVVFWHGRTQWPVRCWNFNVINDVKAGRQLFDLPCRFVLFDTGTYLTISREETERRFAGLGPLGRYLHDIRAKSPGFLLPTKAMFDLGDIAALVDPASVRFERSEAPAVDADLRYNFGRKLGEMVRIYHVERDRAFDLLEAGLRRLPSAGARAP
jgi:inosine-uridine nucleoside N-ribohydrolase